jgi:hypothetical protein
VEKIPIARRLCCDPRWLLTLLNWYTRKYEVNKSVSSELDGVNALGSCLEIGSSALQVAVQSAASKLLQRPDTAVVMLKLREKPETSCSASERQRIS